MYDSHPPGLLMFSFVGYCRPIFHLKYTKPYCLVDVQNVKPSPLLARGASGGGEVELWGLKYVTLEGDGVRGGVTVCDRGIKSM